MEIISSQEVNVPSEPSALKRKAVELNKGSWSPEGDKALQQLVQRQSPTSSGESGASCDEPGRSLKRPRLVWTPQLHKKFVDAVAHLGIKNGVPKTILQLMSVDVLTIEQVDSHLQKYHLYLKRTQALSGGGGSSFNDTSAATSACSATDQLFAIFPIPPHLLNKVEESESEIEKQGMHFTVSQKLDLSSGQSETKRPGDWMCGSCQHLNFHRRDSCHCYGDPKSGDFSARGGSSFLFVTGTDVRPGDWHCSARNCGPHNFASRSSCFKCGASKDDVGGGFDCDMPGSKGLGFGGHNSSRWKFEDWICTRSGCNEHNFGSRM